jgi:hypothetical protein
MNVEPLGPVEAALWAAVGALIINTARYFEVRRLPRAKRPPDFGSRVYWCQFGFWLLAGGFIGYAYTRSGNALTVLAAANIGASAPAIVKTLGSSVVNIFGSQEADHAEAIPEPSAGTDVVDERES